MVLTININIISVNHLVKEKFAATIQKKLRTNFNHYYNMKKKIQYNCSKCKIATLRQLFQTQYNFLKLSLDIIIYISKHGFYFITQMKQGN